MTSHVAWAVVLGMALVPAARVAIAEDQVDLKIAEQQFVKSCGTCHAAEPDAEARQGPNLHTAYGRAAGTLSEFPSYSDAVKKAGTGGLVWNEETLDKWIASAADYIPGSTMVYAQPDAEKRKLVIAYLKSLLAGGGPDKAN